jgi:hypothetical protein
MLIKVTDPASIDDLTRFLSRIGFTVDECRGRTVRIDGRGEAPDVVLQQLEIYLQLRQATRPGVSAVVESIDAGSTDEARTQPCDAVAEPVPTVNGG